MTDSNGEFIIDRRKAIASLGIVGVGVTTGLSFANSADSTSEDISVEVDGGGVVDVATAAPASGDPDDGDVDTGLGIEYEEVATENGGGVTGFAGDKSEAVLEHPPYDLNSGGTGDYNDRVLYGAVLEDPGEVNQFLDFTVTIGNVGEIANGDPFDFLTLELALETIEQDENDDPDLSGGDGADELVDGGLESNELDNGDVPDVGDGAETVVGGEDDGIVTVGLTNPSARLRTRPAADFGDEDDFGGYRVIVTGGTASVRNIAGEDRTFDPGSDFDADFDFSVE